MRDNANTPTQLSRSEIESVCTTAARGAGMSWGMAEEAGFAGGWMASRALDGVALLASHLYEMPAYCWPDISPVVKQGIWCAKDSDQVLCPIAVGATLSDYVNVKPELLHDTGLQLPRVGFPALVLPFVASVANSLNTSVRLQFYKSAMDVKAYKGVVDVAACKAPMNVAACTDVVDVAPDESMVGAVSALMAIKQGALTLTTFQESTKPTVPSQAAASDKTIRNDKTIPGNQVFNIINSTHHREALSSTCLDSWSYLYELSLRTTVPESEASRGNAGAAGSDND